MGEPADRSILSLALVQAARIALGVLTTVFAARWIGPEAWGQVGLARSVAQLSLVFVCFGAADLITRRLARDRTDGARALAALRRASGPGAGVAVVATVATLAVLDGHPTVLGLGVLAGLGVAIGGRMLLDDAALVGLGAARDQVVPVLVGRGAQLVGLGVLLFVGLGPWAVLAAAVAGEGLVATWLSARRHAHLGDLPVASARDVREVLVESRSYAEHLLVGLLFVHGDMVMMGALRPHAEVGLYQAAAILAHQLPVVGQVVHRGLMPHLAAGSDEEAAALLSWSSRTLLALSVPLAVGGALVSGPLLMALLGPDWAGEAPVLALLLAAVPLRFLSTGLAHHLTARGHQPDRTRAVALSTVVHLALAALLIPRWGGVGACGAVLFAEGVYLSLSLRAAAPLGVRLDVMGPLARIGVATAAMAILVAYAAPLPVAARIAAGAATYAAVGGLVGAFRLTDVRSLLRR